MGCPAEVKIGNNLTFSICTHDPDTGILTDADTSPSYEIYEEDGATALLSGTMTKRKVGNAGRYVTKVAINAIDGFENGKAYTVEIVATVDGDTGGISFNFTATDYSNIVLAILKYDWTGITGEAARSVLNALRFLRNKWFIVGSTLTVTKEDDSTPAWTSTVTGDANAAPIISSDPT